MSAPSAADRADFAGFCRQASNAQVTNIREKEQAAGREEHARIAAAEAARRGLG